MATANRKKAKLNTVIYIITLIIAAVVFSVVSEYRVEPGKVTGFGPALATVKFNVSSQLDITLTDANISFGVGIVVLGTGRAQLDTTGASFLNFSGTSSANDPFILENTGNVIANVTVNASKTAADWMVASNAYMYYNYTNNEASSCLMDGSFGNSTWYNTTVNINMCQKLNYSDASDAIRFDLRLSIPEDAPQGYKSNSFTFSAVQSA
ncbi:MAG: hypothetical protein V1839_00715 [archaeon]